MATNTELPKVKCRLVGEDGNAFAILGRFRAAARDAGWPRREVQRVIGEAMESSSYAELVGIIAFHCENQGY